MASIYRSRIALAGWEGAPGVNTVYWTGGFAIPGSPSGSDIADFHQELANAWEVFLGFCVTGWNCTVQADVDQLDVETGLITDVLTSDDGDINIGPASGNTGTLSRATQLVIALRTNTFRNGRRLQGRWFVGPLAANCFGSDGKITSAVRGAAEDILVAPTSGIGPRVAVYSRPNGALGDGAYGDVASVTARPQPGVLRSRRD